MSDETESLIRALADMTPCAKWKVQPEVIAMRDAFAALTTALADARAENERLQMDLKRYEPVSLYNGKSIEQYAKDLSEALAAMTWQRVSEGVPTDDTGRPEYLVKSGLLYGKANVENIKMWEWYLGPLPDLPARSEGAI